MLLEITSTLTKKVRRGQGGRAVWGSADALFSQMAKEQIRWNRLCGVSFPHTEKALLQEGSQLPEKKVMSMPVRKQIVPKVELSNSVIYDWW